MTHPASARLPHRVVVVGTGTGVGKTHASLALLIAANRATLSTAGLKPVESGIDDRACPTSDYGALRAVSSVRVDDPPYRFKDPISPHLAAERAGLRIELDGIGTWVQSQPAADLTIIETAGGLLSPLTPSSRNIDLLGLLCPLRVVLVAPNRLGVLHDVGACTLALRTRAPFLEPPCVILQDAGPRDASSESNPTELVRLESLHAFAHFPTGNPDDPAVQRAAHPLLQALIGEQGVHSSS